MGILRIQDATGDSELRWDVADKKSVAAANAIVDKLMDKGHIAYKTDKQGGGEVIKSFDPNAEEIVVAVPLIGG
jgi:hypothetical protein